MIAILAVPYDEKDYMKMFKAMMLTDTPLVSDIINVILLNLLRLKTKWVYEYGDINDIVCYGMEYYRIENKTSYNSITPLNLIIPNHIKRIADVELRNYKSIIAPNADYGIRITYGIEIQYISDAIRRYINTELEEKNIFSLDDWVFGVIIYESKNNLEIASLTKTYVIEDYYKYDSDLYEIINSLQLTPASLPMLSLITY